MKKSTFRRNKPAALPLSEWSFWEKCPEDELEECLVYECARRSTLWPFVWEVLENLGNPADIRPAEPSWSRIYEFLRLFPEFPSTPWLSVNNEVRRERLNKFLTRARRRRPVERAEYTDFKAAAQQRELAWKSIIFPPLAPGDPVSSEHFHGGSDGEGPFWYAGREILAHYRDDDRLLDGTFMVIRVDWRNNDDTIKEALHDWVKEARPADYADYNRAGNTPIRNDNLRSSLRALGAWSLSRALNPFAPPELTRAAALELKYRNECGAQVPLYSSEKGLMDAESKALKRIETITPWHLFFPCSSKGLRSSASFPQDKGNCTAVMAEDGIRFYRKPDKHLGKFQKKKTSWHVTPSP